MATGSLTNEQVLAAEAKQKKKKNPPGALEVLGGSLNTSLQQALGQLLNPQNLNINLQPFDPGANKALDRAISGAIRPLEQQFRRTILPGIGAEATTTGQYGGSRQGVAEGIAASDFLKQVGDISSQMQNQAYLENLQARTQTRGQDVTALLGNQATGLQQQQNLGMISNLLNASPNAINALLKPAEIMNQIGQSERQMDQAFINEALQRYGFEQRAPLANASDILGLIFGLPLGSQQTNTSGGGQGGGAGNIIAPILTGLIGYGLASGAGGGILTALGGLLGSSREYKENLVSLGTDKKGIKWYQFNYKGLPLFKFVGVLAEELKEILPERVIETDHFTVVDYSGLKLEV